LLPGPILSAGPKLMPRIVSSPAETLGVKSSVVKAVNTMFKNSTQAAIFFHILKFFMVTSVFICIVYFMKENKTLPE